MKYFHISTVMAVALFITILAIPGSGISRTFHVDNNNPAAADSLPGTPDKPMKHIFAAEMSVDSGDTIIVHEGTYREYLTLTEPVTDWVTFISEPPHKAVLDGRIPLDQVVPGGVPVWEEDDSPDNIWFVKLKNILGRTSEIFMEAWCDSVRMPCPYDYPCLSSVSFDPGMSEMRADTLFVNLEEGDYPGDHYWELAMENGAVLDKIIRMENFTVKNFAQAGILVCYGKAEVRGNICEYNGSTGIAVNWCGRDTVRIIGNISRYNCGGIGYSQGISVYKAVGPNIFIEGNISHDNFDGGPCHTDGNGFSYDSAEDSGGVYIANNVAYMNAGGGFSINKSDNCILINNTSFNNLQKDDSWFDCEVHVRITDEEGGSSNNILIRNNLIVSRPGPCRRTLGISFPADLPPENCVTDHNLYFRWPQSDNRTELFRITVTDGDSTYGYELNLDDFSTFSLENWYPDLGTGSIAAFPDPIDWVNGGFTFYSDSPAVDAGNEESAPLSDFYNTPRPQNCRVDIGAYEYSND